MIDDTFIKFDVLDWSQTITHATEKWPSHEFRCSAKVQADEDLELVGAPDIRGLPVQLSLIRGEYRPNEKPLERGIGILAFFEEQPASPPDIPRMNPFLHGWWWLPEASYDEIWLQVREGTWRACSVDLAVAPVNYSGPAICWDVSKHKTLFVTRAGVRFERKAHDPVPPKKRGFLG